MENIRVFKDRHCPLRPQQPGQLGFKVQNDLLGVMEQAHDENELLGSGILALFQPAFIGQPVLVSLIKQVQRPGEVWIVSRVPAHGPDKIRPLAAHKHFTLKFLLIITNAICNITNTPFDFYCRYVI